MGFFGKLEKKFGRYAIKNLTMILIICYIGGYIIQYFSPQALYNMTLDPYKIIHGQVWRIFSWLLIPPPEDNLFIAIIMLLFYYSIGTVLERTWGSFQYNLYIFSGMIFTIISSFLLMVFCQIKYDGGMVYSDGSIIQMLSVGDITSITSILFSTYYVNMSIFLAYACTFPDNIVLLMFIIPIKVKVLGFVYGGFLLLEIINGMVKNQLGLGFVYPFVIGGSLMNFVIFFFTSRKYILGKHKRTRAQRAYGAQTRSFEKFKAEQRKASTTVSKHKCAICGRTEKDGEDLTFRFCSKCDGNYEYCQDHLYTHIHFTKDE